MDAGEPGHLRGQPPFVFDKQFQGSRQPSYGGGQLREELGDGSGSEPVQMFSATVKPLTAREVLNKQSRSSGRAPARLNRAAGRAICRLPPAYRTFPPPPVPRAGGGFGFRLRIWRG